MPRFVRFTADALAFGGETQVSGQLVRPHGEELSFLALLRKRFSSDEQLAEQLQSGDPDALWALFDRYGGLVFGIAKRILRDEAAAEDAMQQIFLDVYRGIQGFDSSKGTVKTWLLMFTYQRTFNSRRSQIARGLLETVPLDWEQMQDCVGSTQHTRPIAENRVLVQQVLKTLQPRQRRTIELTYYEGLTAEEVAMRTGESVRVVRHNLYRGLDKLRKALGPRDNKRSVEDAL
jgi:RNA polymerase sigma-70 factor (ECF subfamily)